MARVPYTPWQENAPIATPTPMQSGAAGEALGRGVRSIGAALRQISDDTAEIALREQNMLNEATAKSTDVEAMVKIADLTTKYNSLEGKNAVDAYPKYVDEVKRVRDDVLAKADNPAVKRMLDQTLTTRVGYAVADGARYSAGQAKKFAESANVARIQAGQAQAILSDEEQFTSVVGGIAADARAKAQLDGLDGAATDQLVAKAVGPAWTGRIQYLAMTDPETAKAFFEKHKDKMDPLTRVQGEQIVVQRMQEVGARKTASEIISRGANVTKVTLKGPSEGKPDVANISPAAKTMLEGITASGVVPELKIASGYRDVDRNAGAGGARGSQHIGGNALDIDISDLTDKQKTDLLEQAIANGAKGIGIYPGGRSLHIDVRDTPATWGANANDTHKGVSIEEQPAWAQGPLKRLFNGDIPQKKLAEPVREGELPQLIAQAEAKAEEQFPGNVAYKDRLIDQVRSNYAVQLQQQRDVDRARRDVVWNAVLGMESGQPLLKESDLENNPTVYEAYSKLPDAMKRSVIKQIGRNASTQTMTEEQTSQYHTLIGESYTEPDAFLQRNILEEDLPRAKLTELYRRQQSMIKQAKEKGEQDPHLSGALRMLNTVGVLKAAGLNNPKSKVYKQFAGSLQIAMQSYINENKKQPSVDDIKRMAQGLLAEVPGTGWFSNYRVFEQNAPEEAGAAVAAGLRKEVSVPEAAKARIQQEYLKKNPGYPPLSDDDLRKVYIHNKDKF